MEELVILNGKVKEKEVNWLLCQKHSWHASHFYFPLHYKAGINQSEQYPGELMKGEQNQHSGPLY